MRALLPDHSLGYERAIISECPTVLVNLCQLLGHHRVGRAGTLVRRLESRSRLPREAGLASHELSAPMPFSLAVPMRQEITAALFPPTRSDFAVSGPPAPQNIGKGSDNSKTKINQHACSGRSGHCKQCVHVFLQTCH